MLYHPNQYVRPLIDAYLQNLPPKPEKSASLNDKADYLEVLEVNAELEALLNHPHFNGSPNNQKKAIQAMLTKRFERIQGYPYDYFADPYNPLNLLFKSIAEGLFEKKPVSNKDLFSVLTPGFEWNGDVPAYGQFVLGDNKNIINLNEFVIKNAQDADRLAEQIYDNKELKFSAEEIEKIKNISQEMMDFFDKFNRWYLFKTESLSPTNLYKELEKLEEALKAGGVNTRNSGASDLEAGEAAYKGFSEFLEYYNQYPSKVQEFLEEKLIGEGISWGYVFKTLSEGFKKDSNDSCVEGNAIHIRKILNNKDNQTIFNDDVENIAAHHKEKNDAWIKDLNLNLESMGPAHMRKDTISAYSTNTLISLLKEPLNMEDLAELCLVLGVQRLNTETLQQIRSQIETVKDFFNFRHYLKSGSQEIWNYIYASQYFDLFSFPDDNLYYSIRILEGNNDHGKIVDMVEKYLQPGPLSSQKLCGLSVQIKNALLNNDVMYRFIAKLENIRHLDIKELFKEEKDDINIDKLIAYNVNLFGLIKDSDDIFDVNFCDKIRKLYKSAYKQYFKGKLKITGCSDPIEDILKSIEFIPGSVEQIDFLYYESTKPEANYFVKTVWDGLRQGADFTKLNLPKTFHFQDFMGWVANQPDSFKMDIQSFTRMIVFEINSLEQMVGFLKTVGPRLYGIDTENGTKILGDLIKNLKPSGKQRNLFFSAMQELKEFPGYIFNMDNFIKYFNDDIFLSSIEKEKENFYTIFEQVWIDAISNLNAFLDFLYRKDLDERVIPDCVYLLLKEKIHTFITSSDDLDLMAEKLSVRDILDLCVILEDEQIKYLLQKNVKMSLYNYDNKKVLALLKEGKSIEECTIICDALKNFFSSENNNQQKHLFYRGFASIIYSLDQRRAPFLIINRHRYQQDPLIEAIYHNLKQDLFEHIYHIDEIIKFFNGIKRPGNKFIIDPAIIYKDMRDKLPALLKSNQDFIKFAQFFSLAEVKDACKILSKCNEMFFGVWDIHKTLEGLDHEKINVIIEDVLPSMPRQISFLIRYSSRQDMETQLLCWPDIPYQRLKQYGLICLDKNYPIQNSGENFVSNNHSSIYQLLNFQASASFGEKLEQQYNEEKVCIELLKRYIEATTNTQDNFKQKIELSAFVNEMKKINGPIYKMQYLLNKISAEPESEPAKLWDKLLGIDQVFSEKTKVFRKSFS